MPENTKDVRKTKENHQESTEKSASAADRTKRSYYYDDACGYEIYTADDDGEDDADDTDSQDLSQTETKSGV